MAKVKAIARINVFERVDTLGYTLDGMTIEDAVERLAAMAKKYPGAKLDYRDCSERYDQQDRPDLVVMIMRPETDAEYDKRCDMLHRQAEQRQERDLAEYERLQKLYGKKEI